MPAGQILFALLLPDGKAGKKYSKTLGRKNAIAHFEMPSKINICKYVRITISNLSHRTAWHFTIA
jgi:hypothetical protein